VRNKQQIWTPGNCYKLRIATRLRARRFGDQILTRARQFSILQKGLVRRLGPPSLLFSGYRRLSRWYSGRGVMLTKHCHIAPRLSISGAILLLFSYAFMAFTVTFYWWLCHVEQNVDWEVLCKHAENFAKESWGTNRIVRKSERALSLSWVLRSWKQCHCGTHRLFIRWRQTARPVQGKWQIGPLGQVLVPAVSSLRYQPTLPAILKNLPGVKSLSVSDCTWTATSVKPPFAICREGYTVPMSGRVIYGDITRGGNCQTVGLKWQADLHCFLLILITNQEEWDGTAMCQI
jgi:hypothetical protein